MSDILRIDGVLQHLGTSVAGDADEYMVGRLLLTGTDAHFVAAWRGERPRNPQAGRLANEVELGKFAGRVVPRTAGSPLFDQVIELDPVEQVRKVKGSLSMCRADGAQFKLRWLSPVLVAKLSTGATLSFTLPDADARRRVKAWLARAS